jgi:hypothetical protein
LNKKFHFLNGSWAQTYLPLDEVNLWKNTKNEQDYSFSILIIGEAKKCLMTLIKLDAVWLYSRLVFRLTPMWFLKYLHNILGIGAQKCVCVRAFMTAKTTLSRRICSMGLGEQLTTWELFLIQCRLWYQILFNIHE